MTRWANHIEGAMALIKLRGSEQMKRPIGLDLFTQLRGQYVSFYRAAMQRLQTISLTQCADLEQSLSQKAYSCVVDRLVRGDGRHPRTTAVLSGILFQVSGHGR